MLLLPVRMTLQVGPDGPSCSFTTNLQFVSAPGAGHHLAIRSADGPVVFNMLVRVVGVCHFITEDKEAACLVDTAPCPMPDYDRLLERLDWFKAIYGVDDIEGNTEPESYYKFYRSVLHILGLTKHPYPIIAHDPDHIKVFAEACRSVILAELGEDTDRDLSDLMMSAHRLVHPRKIVEPDGARMLGVVKKLEQEARNSLGDLKWDAPPEKCLDVASRVFSRIRSIPSEKLPEPLRNR